MNSKLYQFVQGVSAVKAFYELLSQSSLNVYRPDENKHVAPVELCPLLKTLYKILIMRYIKFLPCFPPYVCSSFTSWKVIPAVGTLKLQGGFIRGYSSGIER